MSRSSALAFTLALLACGEAPAPQERPTAVRQARVRVPVDQEGRTIEQRNVGQRLTEDNRPGSIKHLYVISAYSGQVLIYSTVRGKVTSSGKRLTPTSLSGNADWGMGHRRVTLPNGDDVWTTEVLQDDGTYGTSVDYVYWWDTKGVYHQHYVAGGQILHISSQPLSVKGVIINMELTGESPGSAPPP